MTGAKGDTGPVGPMGPPGIAGTSGSGNIPTGQTTSVQTLTLQSGGTYLVTVALSGSHQDERQTYVVHTPINGNLNVNFRNLLADTYVWGPQASITLATQDGGGGWQANNNSGFNLKVTFRSGEAGANWSWTAVRLN